MSTYTPIASQTLTSTAAQVTFANIPQEYTDLVLQINTQYSAASGAGLFFNTTGYDSLYSQTSLLGYSSAAQSGRASNQIQLTNNLVFGDSRTADIYTPSIIEIPSYSNPNVYKSLNWRYGTVITSGSDGEAGGLLGTWRKFDAINAINIFAFNINFNNAVFAIGSSFTLYGIAASGGIGSKATGGTVTTGGGYTYHAFTQSGMFVSNQAITADVLVVAGGGGGGQNTGGGGGAGGYRLLSSQSLTTGTYSVSVGAGGLGGFTGGSGILSGGFNGFNSTFGNLITSSGGGGGAGSGTTVAGFGGKNGGSGGGASRGAISSKNGGSGNTPSTSPSQGNNGGNNGTGPAGGGGGGAGAVGANATSNGGAGGAGSNSASSWLSVTGLGVGGFLAGGGGGGVYAGGSAGAGGSGGGGAGGADSVSAPTAGTANTGGGGGGQNNNDTPSNGNRGANGGSGLVIVRYLT